MGQACVLLPDGRRADAFRDGLAKLGYFITPRPRGKPGDVLVLWNRRSVDEEWARRYEISGCPVLVTENGWIGDNFYSLCCGHHNGAGTWEAGTEDRWSKFGIKLKPWRASGRHILILPQRGIGEPGVAMPKGWAENTVERLKAITDRPIVVRCHPGKEKVGLGPDLEDCWAAVTWASGAGIKAIIAGVPVFYDMEKWVGGPAAKLGIEDIEDPFVGDRMPMLHRLSYAQWTIDEIATGEPFARLLPCS